MSAGQFFMGFSFLGLLIMSVLSVAVIGKAVADESHRLSKKTITERREL